MQMAERIGPALGEEIGIGLANCRAKQGVGAPTLRRVDIAVGRNRGETAEQNRRNRQGQKLLGMGVKTTVPVEFIVKVAAGDGIAIG